MNKARINILTVACMLLLFSCPFLFCGCASVQLIAPYDSQIEKTITTLQSDTEAFLIKVARIEKLDPSTYKDYTDFYDKEKLAVSGLEFRAGVISQNKLTLDEVKDLKQTYEKLEKRHKEKGLKEIDATEFSKAFNRIFRAILTLEIAKKSASSTASAGDAK